MARSVVGGPGPGRALAGLAVEPVVRVDLACVLVELGASVAGHTRGDRFLLAGAGARLGGGLRRAAPLRLAEHRVEGDDVGLDRRRDDVRATRLADVLALTAL